MSSTHAEPTFAPTVIHSLLHNGVVIRGLALAVATVILIAVHHPTWVPYSVSLYAIWNATALTVNGIRAARRL